MTTILYCSIQYMFFYFSYNQHFPYWLIRGHACIRNKILIHKINRNTQTRFSSLIQIYKQSLKVKAKHKDHFLV